MRLLLDTHILLWVLAGDPRLHGEARDFVEDPSNLVPFGAASIWKIAIKASLRRTAFDARADEIAVAARATGFTELPVRRDTAALVAGLPPYRPNPFDRLLVAQAIHQTVRLTTAEPQLPVYSALITLRS